VRWRETKVFGYIGMLVLLLSPVGVLSGQGQTAGTQPQFHGKYEELKPAQKQLIDEWYAEYNRMTNDHSEPTGKAGQTEVTLSGSACARDRRTNADALKPFPAASARNMKST
jgi:hypothetical protein